MKNLIISAIIVLMAATTALADSNQRRIDGWVNFDGANGIISQEYTSKRISKGTYQVKVAHPFQVNYPNYPTVIFANVVDDIGQPVPGVGFAQCVWDTKPGNPGPLDTFTCITKSTSGAVADRSFIFSALGQDDQ